MNPVIGLQFVAFQIDAGEKGIFFESIICDQVLVLSQQLADPFPLLVIAAEQEEDLCLKGISFPIRVKNPTGMDSPRRLPGAKRH